MVRALNDNDVLLAGGVAGELDGSLNSLSSRVPEELQVVESQFRTEKGEAG